MQKRGENLRKQSENVETRNLLLMNAIKLFSTREHFLLSFIDYIKQVIQRPSETL